MKKSIKALIILTIIYLILSIGLWRYTSFAIEGAEEKIKFADFILEYFVSYVTMIGTIFIAYTVYEQIRINKLTELQLELANMPIVSVSVTKGDGAVGIRTFKVICKNIGQPFNYITGLEVVNKNEYLDTWFDLSSRFVPSQNEIEFHFIFKSHDELLLNFLSQEIILKFQSLDLKLYYYKLVFNTSGNADIISLIKK